TFFYGGWESFRQSQAAQSIGLTPTSQELAGDFSGISNQIYNPFSVAPDPNRPGSYTATPFAGNQIPGSLLNPAAELYAKTLLPAPQNTGVAGTNEVDNTPSRVNQESYQGRIDQYFGEKDQLFGRISYYDQNNSSSGGFVGALNRVIISGWNGVIHETHTFGPTAVLDAYFGRNLGDDLTEVVLTNAPSGFVKQLEQVGFSPNFISNFEGGYGPFLPSMGISGYVSAGETIQDTRIADIWQGGGDFTKILGRHTLKLGGHLATNNTVSPIFSDNVSFASTQTQNPENANGTGDPLASFVLGVPDSASKRNVLETEHGGWVDGAYIQDQWKVNDRLTLNYGFRYDLTLWPIYGTPGTPDSYVGDYDLNNGTYIITALPAACSSTVGFPCIPGGTLPAHVVVTPQSNHAILHNDYGDWQGRFGLAYRLTKN
ncbi:MAG: TonB-dependent receptor, partial [Bryobacteraceae bacterium]